MTKLNTTSPNRLAAYDPEPFLGALPLPSTDASTERWRTATRMLFNPTPSFYAEHAQRAPQGSVSLTERLFDSLAAFKLKTALLAAAHLSRDERTRLFKQLDSLFDPESWDSADVVTTEASFTTLLRMVLFLQGRRPALGVTGTGNFIATWTEGDDRLTVECQPKDHIRWVLVQNFDGERETAAGETTVRRLPEVLHPYDPPKRWFPHALEQASA
jgi:hypothetical protein